MKKVLALIAVLLIASVGIFCAVGATVNKDKDTVVITENILYGDKSAAEGITIKNQTRYDRHLFWDTTYTIGEPAKYDTEFWFSAVELRRNNPRNHMKIALEIDIAYGCDFYKPAEEQPGIERAYKELYDAAKPGEELKRVIRLKDYYEYYPIGIEIDLPDTYWHGFAHENLHWTEEHNDYKYVWNAFNEFFKIPVPEDMIMEISISKGHNSNESTGIGSSFVDKDSYYMSTVSTYSDSKCFFTINNRTNGGKSVDTSLIPGGYGIYAFSYGGEAKKKSKTGIDMDSLKMVYPLDEETVVVHLSMNTEKTKLLLLTNDGEELLLTIIDATTMTELQKLSLGAGDLYEIREYGAEHEFYEGREFGSFIVLYLRGNKICLLVENKEGEYEHKFTVDSAEVKVMNSDFVYWKYPSINYDGKRLVVVDYLFTGPYNNIPSCGYDVAVYEESGLTYYAEYGSSLSTHPYTDWYEENCLPADDFRDDKFVIEFGE